MTQRPQHYYHYTTRENRDSILRDGVSKAGKSGGVYFSPTRYDDAVTAMEELAILDKVVECCIQASSALFPEDLKESVAHRIIDPETGQVLRHGGGLEVMLSSDFQLPISTFDLN